jgi:hypothetical protein
MRIVAIVLLLTVTGFAQEAKAPELDPYLLIAWRGWVVEAARDLKAKQEALAKSPEYVAMKAAEQRVNQIKAKVQQDASKKHAGYVLDMEKWVLVPQK